MLTLNSGIIVVSDINELETLNKEVKEVVGEVNNFSLQDRTDMEFINRGIEEIDFVLTLINEPDRRNIVNYLKINGLDYGIEDADAVVANIKKIALGILKFILKIVDKILGFVSSFFNKGMSLTEKLYIASIVRKRKALGDKLDGSGGNKNKPLELSERKIRKIMKRTDFYVLTAIQDRKVSPQSAIEYIRGTLTLFTDNVILFDNTVDSLVNLLKDMNKSDVNKNTFIGYFSEKNKFLITALGRINDSFNRNTILKLLVSKALAANRKDGFETIIIPTPLRGRDKEEMGYVCVHVRKHESIGKLDYNEVKSVDEFLSMTQSFVSYKDLGIDINKVDSIKIEASSFTEIDTMVEAFTEASEKIKKKLNTDKIIRKLEKLKKQLTTINSNEFDSKGSNFKLSYLNTGIKIATGLLESSQELYKSGYCDSLKDYILSHEV